MTTSPQMMAGDFPVPDSINVKWEEAKKNRDQTTTIPLNGDWYIIPKEGFLVNYIKVNGNTGTRADLWVFILIEKLRRK